MSLRDIKHVRLRYVLVLSIAHCIISLIIACLLDFNEPVLNPRRAKLLNQIELSQIKFEVTELLLEAIDLEILEIRKKEKTNRANTELLERKRSQGLVKNTATTQKMLKDFYEERKLIDSSLRDLNTERTKNSKEKDALSESIGTLQSNLFYEEEMLGKEHFEIIGSVLKLIYSIVTGLCSAALLKLFTSNDVPIRQGDMLLTVGVTAAATLVAMMAFLPSLPASLIGYFVNLFIPATLICASASGIIFYRVWALEIWRRKSEESERARLLKKWIELLLGYEESCVRFIRERRELFEGSKHTEASIHQRYSVAIHLKNMDWDHERPLHDIFQIVEEARIIALYNKNKDIIDDVFSESEFLRQIAEIKSYYESGAHWDRTHPLYSPINDRILTLAKERYPNYLTRLERRRYLMWLRFFDIEEENYRRRLSGRMRPPCNSSTVPLIAAAGADQCLKSPVKDIRTPEPDVTESDSLPLQPLDGNSLFL